MKVGEIDRTAAVSWSPIPQHASLIASGTVAGTLDINFNTNAHLEIFSLDLSQQEDGNGKLKLLGKTSAVDRFSKLCWSQAGSQNGSHPYGIIAGGLANGSINIWDPAKIINGENEEDSLIACCEKHTGPVQGLEFNPFQHNYLASGGQDSEILIWDFAKPSDPTVYNPGSKSQQNQDSGITAVAWNRKVQHILASTNYSGVISIWDLKAKRSVLQFSDQTKRLKCRAIAWNPEEPTQIITASEDDSTPILELWDLRNTYSPTKYFDGHTKGIWSISWCPMDYDLLLSSGRDCKTLCWDVKSGSILCEVETNGGSWNFDVQWSPRVPTLLSTCSLEGKVKIFSLQDVQGAPSELPIQETQKKLTHAPKWLQPPIGVSFGFGGKIVGFKKGKSVMIYQLESDPELHQRLENFNQILVDGDLKKFCEDKISGATDEHEKESWKLLQAMLGDKKRYEIMKYLGFEVKEVEQKMKKLSAKEEATEKDHEVTEEEKEKESVDVFEKLAQEASEKDQKQKEVITFPEADSVDGKITQALLVGDYDKAVNICIENDRMADALILAKKTPELWEKTQEKYFGQQSRPFIWVISAIVKDDFKDLIERVDLSEWKSVLAILCLYANSDDFAILCNLLGDRLKTEKQDEMAASICYITAGDVEKTVQQWTHEISKEKNPHIGLQNFIEKVLVFREALGEQATLSETLLQKFSEYANLLAASGKAKDALELLSFLSEKPDQIEENAIVLLDRLYNSQSGGDVTSFSIPTLQKVKVGGEFAPAPSMPATKPSFGAQTPSRMTPPGPTPGRTPLGQPPTRMAPSGPIPGRYPSGQPPSRFTPMGIPPSGPGRMPTGQPGSGITPMGVPPGQPPSRMTPTGPPPSGPPPGSVPSRMTPSGPPPSRMTPSGPPPSGSVPSRMTPSGPLPSGGVPPPSRMTPSGPPPSGPAPSRMTPSGPPPSGPAPSRMTPSGPPPSGPTPSGPAPSRMAPSTPPPSSPEPVTKVPSGPPPSGPAPARMPPSGPPPATSAPPPKPKEEKPKEESQPANTSPENQTIIDTIESILSAGSKSNVPKIKKSAKDTQNRLSDFLKELSKNKISNEVREDVLKFVQAVNSGDTAMAREIHTAVTKNHWEELGSNTVLGLKRLIDITKQFLEKNKRVFFTFLEKKE